MTKAETWISVIEGGKEIAAFLSREVTRIEVVYQHGDKRWVMEGSKWWTEDESTDEVTSPIDVS